MLGELIGEFTGRNMTYRVLSDGKTETSGQGTGKLLGKDAFVMFTAVVVLENGVFSGEENCIVTTTDGDRVNMKINIVSWPSGRGGVTRGASIQRTRSQKLARLNKVVGLHEYDTDENGEWEGKMWEWK
ncbi:MAG: hypothetical protein NWF00_08515 [Candidatus Bathyarchaeota archaeon]|nr:hypothetical protein [Candidatus Bathyarchaeota archaeon]